MFRALSLATALTVALGPHVGLLCDLLCPPATEISDCHQDSGVSDGLTSPDACEGVFPSRLFFVPDEGRRARSPLDTGPAELTVRAELAGPNGNAIRRSPASTTTRVPLPPLLVALRL